MSIGAISGQQLSDRQADSLFGLRAVLAFIGASPPALRRAEPLGI
jgi:hypothetical protein